VDTLGPTLGSLRDAVVAGLADCDQEVGLVTLAPGAEVAWDNCCEGGGQLWVRVISATPNPQPSQPCDITDLRVRVGVGIVRCMHGLSDEGAPTSEQMTGDTLAMTGDADIMLRAIRDWDPGRWVPPKTLVVESGVPLGPSGFCGGWEWTLSFRLLLCSGC
jgi:hypothetical protein